MNDFNPDQKPHILSIPESLEGGRSGFGNDSSEGAEVKEAISKKQKKRLARQQLGGQHNIAVTTPDQKVNTPPEVEEGEEVSSDLDLEELQADLETVTDENSSTTEGGSELDPDSLNFDLDELVDQGIEESKPKFEVNEDGLSVQGAEIKGIKSQIQQLESGQGEAFDAIQNEILQSRQESRISLENQKTKLEGIQLQLLQMIEKAYNKLKEKDPKSTESIKEFTEKARSQEKFGKAITDNEDSLLKVAKELQTFDQETENQVQAAIQKRLEDLQGELTESQASYTETGAEENDKKVLLERQLEGQLTDPDNLFSDNNIEQIFATYGLKEGRDRLQQLQEQSDKAREQAARNEIQDEIVSQIHHHLDSGRSLFQKELVDAISRDMQSQLEVLLQESEKNSPEYSEINKAFTLSGADRISYIANSRNAKLQELVFWYKVNLEGGKTTAEILGDGKNNNLAKYVAEETNRQYKEQEQKIQQGDLDGQGYLHSKLDNKRRVEIDSRIESQFNTVKTEEIDKLKSEISVLESAEDYYSSDRQDKLMLAEKEALRPSDVSQFNGELEKALQSGQITFKQGDFNSVENIPAKNAEINGQLDSLSNETKSLIKNSDQISPELRQRLQSLEIEQQRKAIQSEIDSISSRRRFKWFGIGKKKAESLTSLQNQVNASLIRQNELNTQFTQNQEQYQKILANISRLKELYNRLPQSIKASLNSLENSNFANINTTIETAMASIQSYETPAELKAQRDKIAELQKQIEELEGIE
jgi:hypothetical protein